MEIFTKDNKSFLIDDEDIKLLNEYHYFISKAKHNYYVVLRKNRKLIKLHRLLLNLIDPKIAVDHINGNSLDNRKNNLRIATFSQNCCSRGMMKSNTSGYRGVSWSTAMNQWKAGIFLKRKYHYLGCYKNKNDAAKAYNVKALELFGEFAVLNNIKDE